MAATLLFRKGGARRCLCQLLVQGCSGVGGSSVSSLGQEPSSGGQRANVGPGLQVW